MSGAAAVGLVAVQFIPGVDAIVDAVLFVGTAGLAAAVLMSHSHSQTKTKDSAQDKPCAECGEVGCFEVPEGSDPDKFKEQLEEQEAALKKLKPEDLIRRIKEFIKNGRPNDSAARKATRVAARKAAYDETFLEVFDKTKSIAEAEKAAQAAEDAAVAGKDATHALDWVAGGDGEISGMGDSTINRSIGSQWIHNAPGSSNTRQQDLLAAAEAAKKAGKETMEDIKLKLCEET